MKNATHLTKAGKASFVLAMLAALGTTGCQIDIGGQTLPSPYYHDDDVQYFAPGPEFKLSKEAAALQEFAAERELEGR